MKTRTLANKILSLLCAIAVLMSSVPGLAENLDLAQQAPSSGSAVFGVAVAAGRQTDFSYEDEGEYAAVAITGTYREKPAPSVRDALVTADLTVLETWTVDDLNDDASLTLTASVLSLPEDDAPLSFYALNGDKLGDEIQGELAVDDEITIDLAADGVTGVAVVKGEAPVKEDDVTAPAGDAAVTVETSATETSVSLMSIEGMDVLAAYSITVTPTVVEPEPSIPTRMNAAKTQNALNTKSTASQTQSAGLTKGQTSDGEQTSDATRGGSQTETTGNQVRFYNEAFAEAKSISVYRMGESESDLVLVAENLKAEDGWVSFEADSSSVYVIAGVIEKEVEIDGSTYRISVAYDSLAGIPDGAELAVSEVDASAYLSDTAEALKWADDATVYYAKFLDISIEKDGVEIKPATPVSVTVTLLDVEKGEPAEALQVVHFGKNGAEELSSTASAEGVVTFTTESFSTFGFGSILKTLKSWTDSAASYALQGFSTQQNPTYEAVKMTMEEGLEVLNTYLVSSDAMLGNLADLWVKVSDVTQTLKPRESVVLYEVKGGEITDVLAEETAEEDMSASLKQADGFAVVLDTGFRNKSIELDNVTLAGLLPKEAEAEVTDASAAEAVIALEGEDMTTLAAYDITITESGEEYQPDEEHPVAVSIAVPEMPEDPDTLSVWHIKDDATREEIREFTIVGNEVQFTAVGFSVYAIVGTIEQYYLASDGNTYKIIVEYTNEANIPEGAELVVREIVAGTEEYEQYLASTKDTLDETETVDFARFFDIKIVKDGIEIRPEKPVTVTIQMVDDPEDELKAIHFGSAEDDEPKLIDTKRTENGVEFPAESFSVYGLVEFISTTFITADGVSLTVSVYYDKRAEIPEGATLEVHEVMPDDEEEWLERSMRFADVLYENFGNVTISDARFLKISIRVDGEEYIPKAPVTVKVSYNYELITENAFPYKPDGEADPNDPGPELANFFVGVHYDEEGAHVINSKTEKNDENIVQSKATVNGFSDYDFAYVYEYITINHAPSIQLPNANEVNVQSLNNTSAVDEAAALADSIMTRASGLSATKSAGGVPEHNKNLDDNGDGTYTISMTVKGEAETSSKASPVNILIVYDISSSMVNNTIDVPSATGRYGYVNNQRVDLYNSSGNRITSNNYTGDVYTRSNTNPGAGNYDFYTGNGYNRYYYTRYTGQRYNSSNITRADAAEKVVYDFITNLMPYQNSEHPENIEVAFEPFAGTTDPNSQGVDWTSDLTTLRNMFSSTGAQGSRKLSYSSGTNWEGALDSAVTKVNSKKQNDNDPTFVVFITDGAPYQHNSPGDRPFTANNSSPGNGYDYSADEAREVYTATTSTGGTFYGIYAFGREADYLASLMYYAYNGSRATAYDTSGTTFDTAGYYNAGDEASLIQAINDIFTQIVQTLGIGAVTISDGTTQNVETTTGNITNLLVVEDSYEYWLTIPIIGNQFTMTDPLSGDVITYTVSTSGSNVTISWDGGSATYTGAVQAGSIRIKWEGGTSFYNKTPPAASNVNSSVVWNLNTIGTLLNGVTYEVTFECYPSETTLDLIADLKNGKITYNSLHANIRKYLKKSPENASDTEADYILETNTTASLSYTDTRTENGPQTAGFDNPPPTEASAVETLTVTKDWQNSLDGRYHPGFELAVLRDGENYWQVGLNDQNSWQNSVFASIGILTVHNNTVSMKVPGHEFTFKEPTFLSYHWEFHSPIVRPMKINGVDTILVKLTEEEEIPTAMTSMSTPSVYTSGEDTYYKLYDHSGTVVQYYKVDEEAASLTATNYRRSSLNVKKVVTGNGPEGDVFPFTINVVDVYAGTPYSQDGCVWFSVQDSDGNLVMDDNLASGEDLLAEISSTTGEPTGYYYIPSGNTITVNMKDGYNVRFLNLPTGSTYTVTESDTMPDENYSFDSVVGERLYKEDPDDTTYQSEAAGTVNNKTISGTIEEPDSIYQMTYNNKYESVDVVLTKTVSGDFGDTSKDFSLTIESSSQKIVTKKNTEEAETTTRAEGATNVTKEITIKHGDSITITVPKGATVTLTEDDGQGNSYTKEWKVDGTVTGTTGRTNNTLTLTDLQDNKDVALDNSLEPISPTGYTSYKLPYIFLFLAGAFLLLLLARRKRRA